MTKVLFVCLGNICRSPMAEAVFREKVKLAGLSEHIEIDSAGTASYHIGKAPDHRTLLTLKNYGIHTPHRCRRVCEEDFYHYDWIVAMDISNRENLRRIDPGDGKARLVLMRDFEPSLRPSDLEVPDPYYGEMDGFEEVYSILDRCCSRFLENMHTH